MIRKIRERETLQICLYWIKLNVFPDTLEYDENDQPKQTKRKKICVSYKN